MYEGCSEYFQQTCSTTYVKTQWLCFIFIAFCLPLPCIYFQAFQSMASKFGGSGSLWGPLSLWKHIKESFTLKIYILKILDLNLTEKKEREKKGIV